MTLKIKILLLLALLALLGGCQTLENIDRKLNPDDYKVPEKRCGLYYDKSDFETQPENPSWLAF